MHSKPKGNNVVKTVKIAPISYSIFSFNFQKFIEQKTIENQQTFSQCLKFIEAQPSVKLKNGKDRTRQNYCN